jgi:sugar lactone lactonase YvrE
MKKNLRRKILAFTLSLMVLGCTNSVPGLKKEDGNLSLTREEINQFDREYNFSDKALTESYLARKIKRWLGTEDGQKMVKELSYARVKLDSVLRSVLADDPPLLKQILAMPEVADRQNANPAFDSYVNNLEQLLTGYIFTVAGTGEAGFDGDGGPATSAMMDLPGGVATDDNGNLYFADPFNNRVRKVDKTGKITTFAGTGNSGYNGDGIAASSADLSGPNGVAVDGNGNVYIADVYNMRIRKVNASDGKIATVAGDGTFCTPATAACGDGGSATSAKLSSGAYGIGVDGAGSIYIADQDLRRIRKVNVFDGKIKTIAGTGVLGFSGDNGPASSAKLSNPNGVAVDNLGNVYIADTGNDRVRKIDKTGKITTIAGSSSGGYNGENVDATSIQISAVFSVAPDNDGNIFFGEMGNDRVRKINNTGKISTVAGTGVTGFSGDKGPATNAMLFNPTAVTVDKSGDLYFADYRNYRIRVVNQLTSPFTTRSYCSQRNLQAYSDFVLPFLGVHSNSEILVKDLDTNVTEQLTFDDYFDVNPVLSPDKTKIVFTSDEIGVLQGIFKHDLYVIDVHGGNRVRITTDSNDYSNVIPSWSADSSKVLYTYNGVLHEVFVGGGVSCNP